MMMVVSLICVSTLLKLLLVQGSYAHNNVVVDNGRSFQQGDPVLLLANAITSVHTQLSRDYYALAVCKPPTVRMSPQNLGELLEGDMIQDTPYELNALKESYCRRLCQVTLSEQEADTMKYFIKNGYRNNWLIDDLPSASLGLGRHDEITKRYAGGFPIGFVDNRASMLLRDSPSSYVYNHVNIFVDYYTNSKGGYNIVGFGVEPLSIEHRFQEDFEWDGVSPHDKQLATCPTSKVSRREDIQKSQMVTVGAKIIYTYSVVWRESEVPYSRRWTTYLTEDYLVPAEVHWYSIANSAFIALLLAILIILVLTRNIQNDLGDPQCTRRFQEMEEKGWRLVHVEAIRPPRFAPKLLLACCGTGAQLLSAVLTTVFFAMLGMLSPANRGQLLEFILIACSVAGFVNGYVITRLHKAFRGEQECWSAVHMSMWLFPSITYLMFLMKQALYWYSSSTGAVGFVALLLVTSLWPVSALLMHWGAVVGSRQSPILLPENPRTILVGNILNGHKLSNLSWWCWFCVGIVALLLNVLSIALALLWLIRRCLVKRKCWSITCSGVFILLVGGVFSFGCVYVELFFIMTSVWMAQYYSEFGFLFLVVCILILACAQVSILFNYSLLFTDNYHSWWWQFLSSGGGISLWLLLWSVIFYKPLEATCLLTPVLYFGSMAWVSLTVFLMAGFIGAVASLWFIKAIFAHAKQSPEVTDPLVSGEERKLFSNDYVKMNEEAEIHIY